MTIEHLNFPANLGEIVELLLRQVEELPVLLFSAIGLPLSLHELEHQWPPGADFISPRQEVPTNKGLQNARLTTALAADDGDLRKVDGGLASDPGEDVLKLIDQGDHGGAKRSRWR